MEFKDNYQEIINEFDKTASKSGFFEINDIKQELKIEIQEPAANKKQNEENQKVLFAIYVMSGLYVSEFLKIRDEIGLKTQLKLQKDDITILL